MNIGTPYRHDTYNCAHMVADEYLSVGVEVAPLTDHTLTGMGLVAALRKMFHRVDKPRDWDLILMHRPNALHVGVMRYGRVKHNAGQGSSGAVVSQDLRYITPMYQRVTYWRLNDQSNLPQDRRFLRDNRA